MDSRTPCIRIATFLIPLLGFFMLVSPSDVPLIVIIVPFILLFGLIYNVTIVCLRVWSSYIGKKLPPASRVSEKRVGLLWAGFLVVIMLLSSLGQLTIRDALTLLILFGVGYFYVGRMTKRQQDS